MDYEALSNMLDALKLIREEYLVDGTCDAEVQVSMGANNAIQNVALVIMEAMLSKID